MSMEDDDRGGNGSYDTAPQQFELKNRYDIIEDIYTYKIEGKQLDSSTFLTDKDIRLLILCMEIALHYRRNNAPRLAEEWEDRADAIKRWNRSKNGFLISMISTSKVQKEVSYSSRTQPTQSKPIPLQLGPPPLTR